MKKYLLLFILAGAFACDELPEPDMITNAELVSSFEKTEQVANFINDTKENLSIPVNVTLDWNAVDYENVEITINPETTITAGKFYTNATTKTFESKWIVAKGQMNRKFTVYIDKSVNVNTVSPVDHGKTFSYGKIVFDLKTTSTGLDAKKSKMVIQVGQVVNMKPDIVYVNTFRTWDYTAKKEVDLKNPSISATKEWVDLKFESIGWCGLWFWKQAASPMFESNGVKSTIVEVSGNYNNVKVFNEGEVINEKAGTWYENQTYDSQNYDHYSKMPRFGENWDNKTAYFAITFKKDNVQVYGWMKAQVGPNHESLKVIEYAYEKKGWAIKAGQIE